MQSYIDILRRQDWLFFLLFALILLAAIHPHAAQAAAAGGGSLPWDTPLTTLIIAGGLAASGMNLVSFAVGGCLWFCSIPVFRWMAKADPHMTKVYIRQLKYRGYYTARSRPYRTE
jgi:hypothetical protein